MSMGTTSRTQRRDKSATSQKQVQATAEQLRIAKITDNNAEDIEMKNKVAKILEITGTTEDNARTALYDTNNDANRAIELILENGSSEQNNEWETAGRKKNKNTQQQNNSGRNVDAFEDDFRDPSSNSGQWSRGESRGRGRGKNTRSSRGKNFEPDRANEDEGRGISGSRDRQRGGGARRGRGRGSGRGGRGGQPGRGPRQFRRFNNNRGSSPGAAQEQEFDSQFKSFTNSNIEPSQVNGDNWVNDNEEDWGKLEVGTWSNDEPQKEKKADDSFSDGWGTGSWNDDLAQTKVFQAQSVSLSGTLPPTTLASHISPTSNVGSQPQMGERIDIGTLFTKPLPDLTSNGYGQPNNSHIGYSSNGSTTHAPSVIQQLQQQGQSNSLFSDNKPDHEPPTSRLFGNFDRQSSNTSTNHTTSIGPYGSVVQKPDTSFSQYNSGETTENSGNSALLGSFGEHFISQDQNNLLGDITKSAFTPLKPQSEAQVTSSDYNNFSQAQQREATKAVKASLGLGQEQLESNAQSQGLSPSTLSFGEPLPTRQSKQQRKKPASASSKIPASAVEMPGGSGGSTYQEVSSFDLQFGVDDNSGTQNVEFGASVTQGSSAQNSLFSNNTASSQQSILLSHIPGAGLQGGNIGDSNTIFSSQMLNSSQQSETRGLQRNAYQALQPGLTHPHNQGAVSKEGIPLLSQADSSAPTLHNSQRYNEGAHKAGDTPHRGPPPGISHPQASTAPNSFMSQQDDITGGQGSFGQSRMGNLQDSTMETSATLGSHSYYTTSTSLTQQSQQQDLQNSTGRSMRSPIPSSSLPGSLQSSPMPHISNTPAKDQTASASASQGGIAATHATPRVGATPTKLTSSGSTPINIPGSNSSAGPLGSGYGGINIDYSSSSSQLLNQQSSASVAPVAASPGSHLTSNELYSSSLHSHQPVTSSTPSMQNIIGSSLGSTGLPSNSAGNTGFMKHQSTSVSTASKAGPPNLPLGVPPILSNQYGIPMGPGLMTAYTPDQIYGYTDSLMAVPPRVVNQMPNYYDMSSFHSSNNPNANSSSHNRDSSSNQGKLNQRGGEASSPPSLGMIGSGLAQQQQVQTGQHNQQQLKVSQTGSHQQQPYMNLPTAGHAAYPYNSGLYYNAFQYPMFTAAVPQNAKHSVNTTTAFQQPGTAFGNAYSTASMSSTSNLHDLQPQGYNKSHASAYEKQQATFHHHTNTPPPAFNLQTLTAAMAAANTANGTAGAAPGISPYTQAPFMTMLPTVPNHHQHSQIHHLHLQHGDVGQSVGSQRSQTSNQLGKSGSKAPFGTTNNNTYWAS